MRSKSITVMAADTFATGVMATGYDTSADALEMPADVVQVTSQQDTTNYQSGVRIPSDAAVGDMFTISNNSGALLRVYPASGGAFLPALVTDQADILSNNQTAYVKCAASGVFLITMGS